MAALLKDVEIKEENRSKENNDMETIKLTKENYKSYLPISMVAFSYNLSVTDYYRGHVFVIDDKGIAYEIDNQCLEFSFSDILQTFHKNT